MPRKKRQLIWPFVLVISGILLILITLVVIATQGLDQQTPQASQDQQVPFPEVERVTIQQALQALESGQAVVVDVRGDPYYSQGHIPGALNISISDIETRANELDPNAWIITYCT